MIEAYQWNSPDAFAASSSQTIDGPYIDGISITQGSPRQHIWSYVGGLQENAEQSYHNYKCPCSSTGSGTASSPSFVGEDYYCDTEIQIVIMKE